MLTNHLRYLRSIVFVVCFYELPYSYKASMKVFTPTLLYIGPN